MAGPPKKHVADQQRQRPSNSGSSSSGATSNSSKPASSAPPTVKAISRVLGNDGYDGSRDSSPRPGSGPPSPRLHSSQPASPRQTPASPVRSSSPAPSTQAPPPSLPRPMEVINKNLDLGMQGWDKIRGYNQPTPLPPRTAPSKLGQAAKIGLNTFNVTEYPTKPVYQYDVMINKGDDKRGLIKSIWESQAVKKAIGDDFIWDGNLLAWSTKNLDREIRLQVDLDQEKGRGPKPGKKPDVHRFTMRKTGKVHFDVLQSYLARKCDWDNVILEAINFLDHLLRDGPSKRLTAIKRSFFQRGEQRFDLGSGVEAFKGAYQSLPRGPRPQGSMPFHQRRRCQRHLLQLRATPAVGREDHRRP